MTELISRILVALVGLPLVLGVVWLGGWWVFALVLVAALVALHELYVMVRSLRPLVLAGYAGAVLTLVGAQLGGIEWLLAGALATLLFAFLLYGIASTRQSATVTVASTVLGVVWIAVGLAHLGLLRDLPEHGRLATYGLLLAVFADATAAYAIGRLVGRHKLAPAISPGKTWEGFVAGALAALAASFFTFYGTGFMEGWRSLVFGGAVALAGVAGDLFESSVKRDFEVKDSGSLLAGHGGMLDRVDSLLFSGVAAFYVVLAFGYG